MKLLHAHMVKLHVAACWHVLCMRRKSRKYLKVFIVIVLLLYNVNVHYDTVKTTICLCYYMLLLPRAMT